MAEPVAPRLLLVDDNEANRYLLARVLRRAGFEIHEANDGRGALEAARSDPDLIVLDVKLPDISGYEVCRRLKSDPQSSTIPVLQMSASYTSGADITAGLEGGADAYLTEPVEPGVLLATVRALLRARQAERELRQSMVALQAAQAENALLLDEAHRALQARDDLVAIVSHDLRDPLATIGIGAALLLEHVRGVDPAAGELVARQAGSIQRAVERMSRILEDLLLVEKLQSGHLALQCQPEAASELLREAIEMHRPMAEARRQSLEQRPVESEHSVRCDRGRVLQVFANLIGNAIKFTPEGGRIEVEARASGEHVCFAVADSGPGIAAEDLEHVFDRYWQARRTGQAGAGLGLAIAKGITEAHGGRIWVESGASGTGSVFRFTLPRGPAEPAPTRA